MTFGRRLRDRLLAGVAILVPTWVTVTVLVLSFRLTRNASLWLLELLVASPLGRPVLEGLGIERSQWRAMGIEALPASWEWVFSAIAIVATILVVYGVGWLSTLVLGRRLIGVLERVVDRVPLIGTVYGASKKVVDAIAGDGRRAFQRVALVEWPSPKSRVVGFVTQSFPDSEGRLNHAVFLPSTPNPTTGFLLVVADADLVLLDWPIEDAVEAVMSGGVLIKEGVLLPPVTDQAHGYAGAADQEIP